MQKLYKAETINKFDFDMRAKYALSSLSLIKNAAKAAFDEIKDIIKNKKSLIIVGSGNNGADGIALYLLMKKAAFNVKVYFVYDAKSEENKELRKEIAKEDISPSIDGFDCYIDAILGASFHPPIKEDLKALLDNVNQKEGIKIALDVPSAYYFLSDITIVFTALKEEMFKENTSAKVVLKNPGFNLDELEHYDQDSFLLEDSDYSIKPFKESDYKNKRGHLLLKAGSNEYKGAAILASKAAFHAGIGLCTLSTDSLSDLACYYPPLIVKSSNIDPNGFDALLAGPGWGNDRNRSYLDFDGPLALDADALLTLEEGDDLKNRAVLTPHLGEAKKLAERIGLKNDSKEIAKYFNAVVVKKSAIVEISDGKNTYFYKGNNPSLGVAGSGDVLSGIIGAFLSAHYSPLDSAINAVILHQRAGRKAKEKYGYYDSFDLINEIGCLR